MGGSEVPSTLNEQLRPPGLEDKKAISMRPVLGGHTYQPQMRMNNQGGGGVGDWQQQVSGKEFYDLSVSSAYGGTDTATTTVTRPTTPTATREDPVDSIPPPAFGDCPTTSNFVPTFKGSKFKPYLDSLNPITDRSGLRLDPGIFERNWDAEAREGKRVRFTGFGREVSAGSSVLDIPGYDDVEWGLA